MLLGSMGCYTIRGRDIGGEGCFAQRDSTGCYTRGCGKLDWKKRRGEKRWGTKIVGKTIMVCHKDLYIKSTNQNKNVFVIFIKSFDLQYSCASVLPNLPS